MKFFWLCLVLVFIISSVAASSRNEADKLPLLALKANIRDDPLGALSSWNNSLHFCQWKGVTCSLRHRDRVTVVDLISQKLEGTLSPHIGNLSFLKRVLLGENKFHGEIPQQIGNLFRLQLLNLSYNSFSGHIPKNLTHSSNLRVILLRYNKLSGGIPVELASLSNLTTLDLGYNELKGTIPFSFGNLTYLRGLSVAENSLTGSIPDNLCHLRWLEIFIVSINKLTGPVPSCLFNLTYVWNFVVAGNLLEGSLPLDIGLTLPNLEQIVLGNNKFSGFIPQSLVNASRLQVITFERNNFTGKVPSDLGRLQDLRRVFLHTNQLGSTTWDDWNFISSLTNCSSLNWLEVSGNSLRGPFPDSIFNLSTQMTTLLLGNNEMYGSIPIGIENLVNLQTLGFNYNNIYGNIPSVIGMLPKLLRLYLDGNRFTGQIPASFGNLSELSILDLSYNELHGRIPPSLGNCHNLFGVDLSNNRLNGTIPKEFIGLSSLKLILNLWNNELSGSLPLEVGNLTDLVQFDVYGNRLSGRIPSTLGNCITLKYLNLAVNFFEGDIPGSLRTLNGLETLDLANNSFSGEIPSYLGNFPLLISLNLSHNQLEGQVPNNGVFVNASEISVVGNSKLCGGVTGLYLPECRLKTFSKKGKAHILKVVIPVVILSLCLALFLSFILLLWWRKSLKVDRSSTSSPSSLINHLKRITYAELHKATNNFSVDNLIGVGGYGSVYKGFLDKLDRIVAVKVLNLEQRGASKSFFSECNALSNIRHRNLLKIITLCSSLDFQGNDFKALVFEFMPNESLEEWLHPKLNDQCDFRYLTLLRRLNICIDVAHALDYLHHHCDSPVVHCDLKPSNILLDNDMTAHVADFGLAKMFSTAPHSQNEGSSFAVKGSIGYVPPEYGMGGEVSMQGDVYSYGILLLELFLGKRPTDAMFENGLSLHNFAKLASNENVMNMLDPRMIVEDDDVIDEGKKSDRSHIMKNHLVSVIRLGVRCSAESPIERTNISEVISILCDIRDYHQTVRSVEGEKKGS